MSYKQAPNQKPAALPARKTADAPPIAYNVVIVAEDGTETHVAWGEEAGWYKRLKDQIESAAEMRLEPKPAHAQRLPAVTQALGPGRQWLLFSRVTTATENGAVLHTRRLYALGYKDAAGIEHLQIIDHITGVIETIG